MGAELITPVPMAGQSAASRMADLHKPRRADLIQMAAFALVLRAVFFLIVALRSHVTFHQWAARHDGSSYIAYARALLGDASQMTEYDQRVFPGYPALIALVHRVGVPFDTAAVGLDWAGAALVAVLGAMLFRDCRIGWALTCLPLQYFINSSLSMSETPMLALSLGGLLLVDRGQSALGGTMMGLAGLVRPMACFAAIGQFCRDLATRRFRSAIVSAGLAAGVFLTGFAAVHVWSGDALRGAKVYANAHDTYNGHLFQWPGYSLVHQSMRPEVPLARVAYIWLHVALTFAALTILSIQCLRKGREADPRDLLAAPWLAGNTLFVLCIGSYWGFQHFPRFLIPALPALLWALRGILPRRRVTWAAVAGIILICGVFVVMHEFVVPE